MRENLPRKSERRTGRAAKILRSRKLSARRPSDSDAHRPAGALDIRPVRRRQRTVHAGAQFRSPAEPWADACTSTGRLTIAALDASLKKSSFLRANFLSVSMDEGLNTFEDRLVR